MSESQSAQSVESWTLRGLLEYIQHIEERMKDRSFAFLLGAGASQSSGVSTGKELVHAWLDEMRRRYTSEGDPRSLGEWATADNLRIADFDFARAEQFYPQVFERRFGSDPDEGYAALEAAIEGKEPSVGYSILARVMATSRHKVVITTNFDSLVADALYSFTNTHPLVASHETLAGFIRPQLRRPLVAQVHRSLLLAPQNDEAGTSALARGWEPALRLLLKHYSLLVIGYGGNDGSVMGLMQRMKRGDLGGRPIWCHLETSGPPDRRITDLLAQLDGVLVPIAGFDELMLEVGRTLRIPFLLPDLERQARQRIENYRKSVEALQTRLKQRVANVPEDIAATGALQAISDTAERLEDGWSWVLKARAAASPAQRDAIYEAGLEQFPNDYRLLANYALAVHETNPPKAELLFRKALTDKPDDPIAMTMLAYLIGEDPNRGPEAHELYKKATTLDDSGNAGALYATFLAIKLGELERAEIVLRETVRRAPANLQPLVSLVGLLLIRGRFSDARATAIRATELAGSAVNSYSAVATMYRGMTSRMDGREDTFALGRLHSMLDAGFEKTKWFFDEVLASAAKRLRAVDLDLYKAIGNVISGTAEKESLDHYPRWVNVTSVAVSEDWPQNA